jgi:hypothetical protein
MRFKNLHVEGMDDEDNAVSGRLGAANGEHTSRVEH